MSHAHSSFFDAMVLPGCWHQNRMEHAGAGVDRITASFLGGKK